MGPLVAPMCDTIIGFHAHSLPVAGVWSRALTPVNCNVEKHVVGRISTNNYSCIIILLPGLPAYAFNYQTDKQFLSNPSQRSHLVLILNSVVAGHQQKLYQRPWPWKDLHLQSPLVARTCDTTVYFLSVDLPRRLPPTPHTVQQPSPHDVSV